MPATGCGNGCAVATAGTSNADVVWHPRAYMAQQYVLLPADHPATLGYPAAQSKRSEVVVLQPRPTVLQHQACLGIDHPRSQLSKPALQSKGNRVVTCTHPRAYLRQHQLLFSADHCNGRTA
mmetsp:Transcript_107798/g.337193  ORF Transcript_107798/g.337193 Transcript_107798/m.337193 type:complete len:122 (-) Transcript_107798:304-669(-)